MHAWHLPRVYLWINKEECTGLLKFLWICCKYVSLYVADVCGPFFSTVDATLLFQIPIGFILNGQRSHFVFRTDKFFLPFPQITRKTFDYFTDIFTLMIYCSWTYHSTLCSGSYRFSFPWCNSHCWARPSSLSMLNDHTQTYHSRCAETLYQTTHKTHKRHPFPGRIQTHNLSNERPRGSRLRRHSHRNRCELEKAPLNT